MRYGIAIIALGLSMLSACGGGSATCGEAECAPICEKTAGETTEAAGTASTKLTTFEDGLLAPVVEDVRAGVRSFDEQGIGICRGTKECEEFLGSDVGELPPGDYMVKAELRVPKIGEPGTWSITFDTSCDAIRKTESGETTSTSNSSRSYDVRYAGEQRGYRLMPLRTIESPSKGGARKCTYTITAPHPDGDKVYKGSWETPDAG